jgi:hypothetical protein
MPVRKYGNKKITVDGVTFDSKKEYMRWCELCQLEKAGHITELRRQVKYVLIPAQYEEYERYSKKTGKRLKNGLRCVEKEVSYIADFVYKQGDQTVVEDTKSPVTRTAVYIVKRKLMLYIHGIKIKEV